MTLLEKTQKRFKDDRFATEVTGVRVVDVKESYALCELDLNPSHRNAVGGVMGGVIFTLADFAFAVAANTGAPETVSTHCDISFLNGVKGNVLRAETTCEKAGRRTCTYRITVMDDFNTKVAIVTISGLRLA